ncbi:hypothetical protein QL285_015490 [Trifolium repens]|nr:hypothetical protein QL285_015490 [Trifolium repens]
MSNSSRVLSRTNSYRVKLKQVRLDSFSVLQLDANNNKKVMYVKRPIEVMLVNSKRAELELKKRSRTNFYRVGSDKFNWTHFHSYYLVPEKKILVKKR